MTSDLPDGASEVRCPLCGGVAEVGALYGADQSPLKWHGGPVSWAANVAAALPGGEVVGDYRFGAGVFAAGVRCRTCRRIVLDV